MENLIFPEEKYYSPNNKVIEAATLYTTAFSASRQAKRHIARNSSSIEKIYKDNYQGKIAEFFAAWFLSKYYGFPKIIPNIIVKPNNFFFSPDLIYKDINIHVKSSNYYIESYVFEKRDPIIIRPKLNDYIILIKVKDNKYSFRALLSAQKNIIPLYKPLKKNLPEKTALYWEHIILNILFQSKI